jgi:hypothetical protein
MTARILYLQVPANVAVVPTTNYCMLYKQVFDIVIFLPKNIVGVFIVLSVGASYTGVVGHGISQYDPFIYTSARAKILPDFFAS